MAFKKQYLTCIYWKTASAGRYICINCSNISCTENGIYAQGFRRKFLHWCKYFTSGYLCKCTVLWLIVAWWCNMASLIGIIISGNVLLSNPHQDITWIGAVSETIGECFGMNEVSIKLSKIFTLSIERFLDLKCQIFFQAIMIWLFSP